MRPEPKQPAAVVRWPLFTIPAAVAVAVVVAFVARDGFAMGDLVGALAIGLATLAVLAIIQRVARR